jgi:putative peptidoglycan binding protein
MKGLHLFYGLMVAALAALLPVTARAGAGHSMGGAHSMGGHRGMAPHISSGHGFGHEFGRFDHRHDFAFRHHDFDRFRDRDFDRDDRFFHHRRFFFGFDFASFGFPYTYYYGYPYDYSYYDYGPAYDYQYWNDLAVSVQSELARRGYYHGSIDGVIGAGSREAIRAFQAAQELPVTERIDPKLLKALGVSYRSA